MEEKVLLELLEVQVEGQVLENLLYLEVLEILLL